MSDEILNTVVGLKYRVLKDLLHRLYDVKFQFKFKQLLNTLNTESI